MTATNRLDAIAATVRSSARARLCRRLARVLATSFRIAPHEDHLVWFLGRGDERTNEQALEHWVEQALDRQELDQAPALLHTLLDRLEHELQELEPWH